MNEPVIVYSVSIVVVILIGISKAGFAGGMGVVATPLLCMVMKPTHAVGVLLPLLCACDWFSLYFYRKDFAVKPLLLSLPGALAGVAGASFLLGNADETMLKVVVGAIALIFVFYRVTKIILKHKSSAWKPGPCFGALFGGAAGFFSTLAHAAGPITAAYLLPQNLGRKRYVGTTVVFFTIVNHVKLIPYWSMDLLDFSNLKQSLMLSPFVPLGVWLGVWLNRKTNEKTFLVIIYSLLFITGLKLIWG